MLKRYFALFLINERIMINGDPISDHDFTELFESVYSALRIEFEEELTFFRILTLMAFKYFIDQKVIPLFLG